MNLNDILVSYHFDPLELSKSRCQKLLDELKKTKLTYPFILETVESDRTPETVLRHSEKIGMFIPAEHRYGLNAYLYYLNNVEEYEIVLDSDLTSKFPSQIELFVCENPITLLKQFKDYQIINSVDTLIKSFDSREDLLKSYIEANITSCGRFSVPINSIESYENIDCKTVFFTKGDSIKSHSISDMIDKIDSGNTKWDNLCMLHLRLVLLKKVSLWRELYSKYETPDPVIQLIDSLGNHFSSLPEKELARNYLFTENFDSLENVVKEF